MTDKTDDLINQLQLDAIIENIGLQRYTPAGILTLDLLLKHQSRQSEAEGKRQVELAIKAIAFDGVAREILSFDMNNVYRFSGFLATRAYAKQVFFHITRVETV